MILEGKLLSCGHPAQPGNQESGVTQGRVLLWLLWQGGVGQLVVLRTRRMWLSWQIWQILLSKYANVLRI